MNDTSVTTHDSPTRLRPRDVGWRVALVVLVAATATILLERHFTHMNGWLWRPRWRHRAWTTAYLPALLCMVPMSVGLVRFWRGRWKPAPAVAALTLSGGLLMFVMFGLGEETGFERIRDIVEDRYATSYYLDALELRDRPDLLADYPELIGSLHLHSMNKPPGQVLFFMELIELFGPEGAAARAGGILLGLLSLLAIPGTYVVSRRLGGTPEAAVNAAAFMALFPGFLLYLPQFDQLYAVFTCLLIASWSRALERSSFTAAAGFAAVLALALMFSHLLLVLGAFLAALTLRHVSTADDRRSSTARAARLTAGALAVFLAIHAVMRLTTGYDAWEMFMKVLDSKRNWHETLSRHQLLGRSYSVSVVSDPWEFAIGTGWVCGLVVMMRLATAWRTRARTYPVEILCAAQIALVPLLGQVRGESMRLLIFLMPLLAVPAGIALERWPVWARSLVFAACWLVTATLYRDITFINV